MDEGKIIGGVYEMAIGITNPDRFIDYWARFGFHVGEEGELTSQEAFKLYGVESKLKSIRLHHKTADHGLIRLFIWDKPTDEGLHLSPMKTIGNRWGAALAENLLKIENHIEEAKQQNLPIYHIPSVHAEIYPLKTRPVPFLDQYACVREMILIQPLTRQVFFQRFDYSVPLYGCVNESSYFQTSQMTHFGMVIEENRDHLDFYDGVLGFLRTRDEMPGASTYQQLSSRVIFQLQEHESYATTDFDDPRSSKDDIQQIRSGRLKILRFPRENSLENKISSSKPGSLGCSLYTLRVNSIEACYARLQNSKATQLTDICLNEFGEKSFSFVAPDGYFWTILQSKTE